jgi:hypothetical protein
VRPPLENTTEAENKMVAELVELYRDYI